MARNALRKQNDKAGKSGILERREVRHQPTKAGCFDAPFACEKDRRWEDLQRRRLFRRSRKEEGFMENREEFLKPGERLDDLQNGY